MSAKVEITDQTMNQSDAYSAGKAAIITAIASVAFGIFTVLFVYSAANGAGASTVCWAAICGLVSIGLAITSATLTVVAHVHNARADIYRVAR
jgi:hypothetical protein